LLFVASAYKYFKKGDDCFVIVYKLGISYKFLDQILRNKTDGVRSQHLTEANFMRIEWSRILNCEFLLH